MRLFAAVALTATLAFAATTRADDLPEGSIGVQIKIDEGKIVVVEPIKGSPAEKAGLKPGDVFVKVNDYAVKQKDATQEDLEAAVKEVVKHKPGEKIKVTVSRGGKEMTLEVTVGKRSEIFPKKDD